MSDSLTSGSDARRSRLRVVSAGGTTAVAGPAVADDGVPITDATLTALASDAKIVDLMRRASTPKRIGGPAYWTLDLLQPGDDELLADGRDGLRENLDRLSITSIGELREALVCDEPRLIRVLRLLNDELGRRQESCDSVYDLIETWLLVLTGIDPASLGYADAGPFLDGMEAIAATLATELDVDQARGSRGQGRGQRRSA